MSELKRQLLKFESYVLLLENSLRSIPFNILIAGLLSYDLFYKNIPRPLILSWFLSIVVVSVIRWFYSRRAIKNENHLNNTNSSVLIFVVLTFIMGCVWGASYLVFLPYLAGMHEEIIILILGGMAAGSVASLSAFLPAYFAYVLPMFLPVIIYNYSFFQLERSILATMFLLFVVMVMIIAKVNNNLLQNIFQLNSQKDSLIDQLSVSNKKLEESNEKTRVMSITDSLTGLYNRRFFDYSISHELDRSKRNKYPLSLILIDIDNFKYINDTYGHPYGDSFLIFVASVLEKSIRRSNDILVRLGGDEFAAILANMDSVDAQSLCDSIKQDFVNKNQHKNITLSIGIITIEPGNRDDLKNIILAVDKMLYKAKESGKNQVISQIM